MVTGSFIFKIMKNDIVFDLDDKILLSLWDCLKKETNFRDSTENELYQNNINNYYDRR